MILVPMNMSWQVLLIEDNANDIVFTRQAFLETAPSIHLHVASDGVEAMAFLERRGVHRHAPRPDLILLDLSLPKLDGREVLARIKLNDELKIIPTIILTTSESEADIVRCYQLQANVYLTKPPRLEAYERLLKSIIEFWLTTAKLPHIAISKEE